jgi:hypothetical protein
MVIEVKVPEGVLGDLKTTIPGVAAIAATVLMHFYPDFGDILWKLATLAAGGGLVLANSPRATSKAAALPPAQAKEEFASG